MNDSHPEVVIIGGGQAGLALGLELTRRDVPFLIVDAAAEPGASWRARWDSLLLFTPAAHNSLPRGVTLTGRIASADGGILYADDGSAHRPRSVVWATGYVPDFSWVDLPVVAPDGWIPQVCGRTSLPGLHTLGLPWQCTNASDLLGWVGRDAAYLADVIRRRQKAGFGCRPAAAGWCIP